MTNKPVSVFEGHDRYVFDIYIPLGRPGALGMKVGVVPDWKVVVAATVGSEDAPEVI